MKNLFEATTAQEITSRLAKLRPDSPPQWGKMSSAQALAHCAVGIEMAMGIVNPPRVFIGRILGPLVKKSLIIKGEPMRRNSPSSKELLVTEQRNFDVEHKRLGDSIRTFVEAGPSCCSHHPHPFFGNLTPNEWASLMYQHLDHHFRQFNV